MRIPSAKVDQVIYFVAVDATDLKTRETGLGSFTVYRSRNGGAATIYTTPTVTELSAANMPGVYSLLIDEDTTIGASSDSEEYCIHITQASMAPVTRTIELYRRDTTTGRTLDVSAGGEAGLDWANIGSPTTAQNLSATNIDVDQVVASVSGAVGSVTGAVGSVTAAVTVGTINANVITATSIANDAITDAKVAADVTIASVTGAVGSVTGAVGSVTGSVGSVVGLTAANLDVTVSSRATPAQVNTEVVDALNVDTYAEPGQGAPAATTTLVTKLGFLYKAFRNRKRQTATLWELLSDDEATVDQKATVSDDATTAIKQEIVSGP